MTKLNCAIGTSQKFNNDTQIVSRQQLITIILLCLGYFLDFYDLTIFSSSYSQLIPEQFGIKDISHIQLLYLKISNFSTLGILCGSVFFGIMGDKFGRTSVIRYSILLYSISIILSVFVHDLSIFILLRFLSGAGLAIEFATSSIIISEFAGSKATAKYVSLLYLSGILGGICAVFINVLSWRMMFFFGGGAGIILYLLRKNMLESYLFEKLSTTKSFYQGSLIKLFSSKADIFKLLRLLILIVPFNFLISIMFIYPTFMPLKSNLATSVRLLLIGFFIGNLISTFFSGYIINWCKSYKPYMYVSIICFWVALSYFSFINDNLFFCYAIVLGLLGGGYPVAWIQNVVKSYGTNQRSVASNLLYALGRCSMIISNLIISVWILSPRVFVACNYIAVALISAAVIIALYITPQLYNTNPDFIDNK